MNSLAKILAWHGNGAPLKATWGGVMGAVVLTIAILAVCWLLRPLLGDGVFSFALAGTTLCAVLFGILPAVLSTILTAIGIADIVMLPAFHWQVPSVKHGMQLAAYLVSAGLILVIAWSRKQALRRVEAINAKKLEETNAKLELAVAARDHLLAVVTHDLRNPLNTIVLSTEVLKMSVGDENRLVTHYRETIHSAALRMKSLIEDLLDLAVLDQGRIKLSCGALSAASVLDQAIETQQLLAGEQGVTLVHQVAEDLPTVFADALRLQQVLSNLIGNAVKFTPPGGTVRLDARLLSTTEVLIGVHDTGTGISEEALPHVFDRYWTGRTMGGQGYGLGLSIAKAIVDAHGGRIWAQNNPDAGASLYFTLPTAQSTALVSEAA